MGTNKCASQSGMTAYGTRRHLYDPKNHILPPMDHSTISLQMGTNKCASQVGLAAAPQPPALSPAVRSLPSPLTPCSGLPCCPHLGRLCPCLSVRCVSGELPPSSGPQVCPGVCLEAHPALNRLDSAIITFPAASPVGASCWLWSTWVLGGISAPRLPIRPDTLSSLSRWA